MTESISEASRNMRQAVAGTVRRRSWWLVIQGVLMAIAGVIAIAYPVFATFTAVVAIGWLLIVTGILQALSLIGAREAPHFWIQLLSISLAIIIGLLLLSRPAQGMVALTLLLIVFFFVEGTAKVVFSLMVRPLPNWFWLLLSGLLAMVLAVVLWSSLPVSAGWLLGLLLGVVLISEGVSMAYFAWSLKHSTKGRQHAADTGHGVAGAG